MDEDNRYWICIIGPVDRKDLSPEADAPPRCAALEAITKMLKQEPENCWSGWGTDEDRFQRVMDAWNAEAQPTSAGRGETVRG